MKEDKTIKLLEVVGKPVNLAMAEYVFHFLEERCETLWLAYKPQAKAMGEKGKSAKNDFVSNLLRAFIKKLDKEKELSLRNGSGEKVVKDTSLIGSLKAERDEFVRSCYPRLGVHRSGSVGGASPRSAAAGWKAGEKLTLHVPLGDKGAKGPQGRLPRGK